MQQYLIDNTQVTTACIVAYVKGRYSVSYSIPGMNKWLHRNGFSYKKPAGVPHKFDAAKQRRFVEKYAELKKNSGNDVPILFMDAVHPHSQQNSAMAGCVSVRGKLSKQPEVTPG